MFEIILMILTCVGITNIIANGSIFEPVRHFIQHRSDFLGSLIECSLCLGFWIGLIASYWMPIPPLMLAALSSLGSQIYSLIIDYFQVSSILMAQKIEEIDGE